MKIIQFGPDVCQNLDQAVQKEWLETNSLGTYSSSTLACANTRRYHGLLVVPSDKQDVSQVLLNGLEENLFIGENAYPLSTQFYHDTVYPKGYECLSEFCLYPFPTWIYRIEDLILAKSIVLAHDENTVLIRYRIVTGDPDWVRMELKPLLSLRNFDTLKCGHQKPLQLRPAPGQIRCFSKSDRKEISFYHDASIVDQSLQVYKAVQYPEERRQGLDFEEDLVNPFRLEYNFLRNGEIFVSASTLSRSSFEPNAIFAREEMRRQNLLKSTHNPDSCYHLLNYSAHSFFLNTPSSNNESEKHFIVTGYPWHEENTRNTLLAFEGLLLDTGNFDLAKKILGQMCDRFKEGLLANELTPHSSQEKVYLADIPLIFIHCCYKYFQRSKDRELIKQKLFPILRIIIERYILGTQGIKLDREGLVACKPGNLERSRSLDLDLSTCVAVEVQAYWYNALCEMVELADEIGLDVLGKTYRILASRTKQAFNRIFWMKGIKCGHDKSAGYLCDMIADGKKDATLRPYQLFALSLPFPVLEDDGSKWQSVLNVVKHYLLTPYGIRTLAPFDEKYQGVYEGTKNQKTAAYYQGCIWPWLVYPYIVAKLRLAKYSKEAKRELIQFLEPYSELLMAYGLGFIPEFFDGNTPNKPCGLTASAVNMGICLQLYDLFLARSQVRQKITSPF